MAGVAGDSRCMPWDDLGLSKGLFFELDAIVGASRAAEVAGSSAICESAG